MKTKKLSSWVVALVVATTGMLAQVNPNGNSFDIGITTGMSSFQTDFGENGDFSGETFGNIGFNIGANFYMGFIDRRASGSNHWFKNHAKLTGNVSYFNATIDHFGNLVEDNYQAGLFEAMHAKTKMLNVGVGLQYFIFDLAEFNPKNVNLFAPYVGVEFSYNYLKPEVTSDLGNLNTYLPYVYRAPNTIFNESISTFSVGYSLGTRIKVSYQSDIDINLAWKNMLSDKLDGLVPQIDANKHNDWLYTVNVGYVFYID